MRVAVITPYHREQVALLEQCHRSVLEQQHACDHIMVADGHALTAIDAWTVEHIKLPRSHDDNGNTPRAIGSLYAVNQGYDAIAYLDADNWFRADHVASLLAAHRREGTPICASGRSIHRLDGTEMPVQTRDGDWHLDTSCLLLTRQAFALTPVWALMPQMLSPICDRMFLLAIKTANYQVTYTAEKTLAFRSRYASHYRAAGEQAPAGVKDGVIREVIYRWQALAEAEKQVYYKRLGFSFDLGR